MPERQVAVKPITQKSIPKSSKFINYAARYPGQSKPSLKKLNFEIKYGSLLGVIGTILNSVSMQGYYVYVCSTLLFLIFVKDQLDRGNRHY